MNHYNLGDIVMIVGKMDNRVRDKSENGEAVIGTIEQFLFEQQVSVILPNGDLWVGPIREIVLLDDQKCFT
jgi:hypothetical protein